MQLGNIQIPELLRGGRYRVGKILGQGGMAVVATAHDTELGVDRAVKVLYATGRSRATLRRRLKSEARAMAKLQHPNILSIHDVGAEGDLDYVVMDLAVGGSLQDKLAESGPFRPSIAIQYIIQTLSALAAAHAEGVVHRDVKPHNILLDSAGRALLADFGIALLTGDDRRTKSGVAMGSLAFMPPEQRLDAAKVGPAADIYSAGSTLFNLLTGENPVDLFLATESSPRWEKVSAPLRPVLMRACLMTPEERWPTAGDMAYALLEVLRSDNDGFNTVEGPLEPVFPAPSQVLSQHTNSTGTHGATILPDHTSSATAHAVEELVKIAPPALFDTHAQTRTSHESTPSEVPELTGQHQTWAPTIATAPDIPVPSQDSRVPKLLGLALLLSLVVAGLLWMLWPDSPTPSIDNAAHFKVEEAPDPIVEQPTEPTPKPEPAPIVSPVPPKPVPAKPPSEPRPEPARASSIAGKWQGTMGGAFVDLQLGGSDGRLRGTMNTTIAGKVSSKKLTGRYNSGKKRLELKETGAAPARFELDVNDGKLSGSVIQATGRRGPMHLSRP